MSKFYYHCFYCLATSVISADKPLAAICGICAHALEFMGKVTATNVWVKKELKCKCDGRCTSAQGPNCDCQCGGENHGAGMMGYSEVIAETGKVVITPAHDAEKHRLIAADFEKALSVAQLRIENKFGDDYKSYKSGVFIKRESWWAIKTTLAELANCKESKVHKTRIAKLAKIAA